MQLSRGEMKYQHLADKLKTHWMKTKGVISETRKRIVMRIQGGLTPGICYTRSNFFIKGGEVTTSTITGDISPCDVKNILTKLNNQLPNFPHMPVHLMLASLPYMMSLQTLPTVNLTYWPTEPALSFDKCSLHTGQMKLPWK